MALEVTLPVKTPTLPCVLKIWVGNKFFIATTHNILWLRHELMRQYVAYLEKGIPATSLWYPIIKATYTLSQKKPSKRITKKNPAPPLEIKMESLFQSASGYKMLKYALETFAKDFNKKNCINIDNLPYVPNTPLTSPKQYTWLTPSDRANYEKLLKKYDYGQEPEVKRKKKKPTKK